MASPLLINSESFRKKILVRNLVPYPKSPSKVNPPIDYEAPISDYSVTDSPDMLIDEPLYSKELYKNNQYGAEGGYKQVPDPGALLNTKSNEGEYGYQDANILDESIEGARQYRPLNAYADGVNLFDSGEAFASLETVRPDQDRSSNGQPYYPLQFVPSTYLNVGILLSRDPVGTNGLLSQDSYIARLGADVLRKEFEKRIAVEITQKTFGRINAFNVRGGTDVLSLVTGRVPLIEPNYRITVPSGPLLAATDFALRLAGSIIPVSPIPGSYFDPSISTQQSTTIQQRNLANPRSALGKFFNRLLGSPKTGSQLFLNNTGGGQKSRLFGNLDYNKYKPEYDRTIFDRLGGALVGTSVDNSNFYVGSTTSEPSRVFSPGGDLPVNSYGAEQQTPVYGPHELAQLYEGVSREVRLGANGNAYINGGGVEGGLTWISPGTGPNAGKRVGEGGKTTSTEVENLPYSFTSTQSTSIEFKDGSIMDQTQRLIDSAPKSGGRRLQHVGNAIDQVSKVFNDGYKEITKGSKVIRYVGGVGANQGWEYCRLWTKDLPYLQYNDLQKSDGMTTQNRRLTDSVLDNTYNLNIYPNKKDFAGNSTNLYGNPDQDGYAKKYMFSLENLAWRTSSKPGFTVADLPICERGPNGGRVMWFAPYGLTFSESSNANWKDSSFIGRPEPIYTYSNTSRGGSLSWKIVVDHPSVLNLVVNKVLNSENDRDRINSVIDSFFAGCQKYDLYELAQQYPLANPNDLYVIQQEIDSRQTTREDLEWIKKDLQSGVNTTTPVNDSTATNPDTNNEKTLDNLQGLGFYFDNNTPQPSQSTPSEFNVYYDGYVATGTKTKYSNDAPTQQTPYLSNPNIVNEFFGKVIEENFGTIKSELNKLYDGVVNGSILSITITLVGTTSAPANNEYNKALSGRRLSSVDSYIKNFKPPSGQKTLGELLTGKLTIIPDNQGEESSVSVKKGLYWGSSFNCTDKDSQSPSKEIYTVNAMACRRVAIKKVSVVTKSTDSNTDNKIVTSSGQGVQRTTEVQDTVTTESQRTRYADNLTKRILRLMTSECDYFESIKEDTPFIYDNLKEKLKFFNPAFHSTTPEGLNSRLTFLQQCLRPGETIPVVKSVNGKATLQYNNAVNTAFGAPPVLVLRIGDFYNTKIIPDSLQITYENLDINPEGIGIQPMIANVTMSFKFVGGSGLREAVDRIQNALSFNFYANTEVYDDRAEVTDTSLEEYDKLFENLYNDLYGPPYANKVQNNNGQNNNSFIGEVLSTVVSESGTTGEISYKTFMEKVVNDTQTYFNTVYNKNKEVLSQYNEAVRQVWTMGRNYTKGTLPPDTESSNLLFGKPSNFQGNISAVFFEYLNQISRGEDQYLSFLSNNKDFSEGVLRQVKQNYFNYITQRQSSFLNDLTKINQEVTLQQQNYLQDIARLNVITFGRTVSNNLVSGTDGLQEKNGYVKTFYTTGNSLNDLVSSKLTIRESLFNFYEEIEKESSFTSSKGKTLKNKLVIPNTVKFNELNPFTSITQNPKFSETNFQYQYMILSQEIMDDKKYDDFKQTMIGNILSNPSLFGSGNPNLEQQFDGYWKSIVKPIFAEENSAATEFLTSIERGSLKNYLKYTSVDLTKTFRLNYSNVEDSSETAINDARNNYIVSLGNTTNSNTDLTTFNNESSGPGGSIYITKVKLN